MTAAEHYADVKRMSREEREAVERQLLIDMAKRYGTLQDRAAERSRRKNAAAIARAKRNAKEGAA